MQLGERAYFGQLPLDVKVEKGETLFPRIDMAKELEALGGGAQTQEKAPKTEKPAKEAKKQQEPAPKETPEGVASLITIDDFAKVSFRVAQVIECTRVEKSDKLLKLQLDDGSGEPRQVVSGIAAWYTPEELVGKKVIIVANLKPAKLRGVMSQGMLLAADVGEAAKVVFVSDDVPNGAKVR